MELPNWADMEFFHWLLLGAAVAVVAVLVYLLVKKPAIRVPAVVVGVIGSLMAGIGVGAIGMASLGYKPRVEPRKRPESGPPGGMMGGARRGGGGRRGGPGGRGGAPGGRRAMMGPSAKAQLATLVAKLDQLTSAQLTLKLTDDEKKAIDENTKGLLNEKALDNQDAQKRLDALLEILKKHKDTLEAAGYRFPGGGRQGFMRPPDLPNPFKDEKNAKHLRSLREQIGKGKADA
jgi:hypothetical protein